VATKSALFRLALVALLLFAQQAALTHATWHAHQPLAGNAHGAGSGDQSGKQPQETQLCGFHLAFGQVLGAASGSDVTFALPALGSERACPGARTCACVTHLPPQSRGPPTLL
jgi:hypothetical protein